MTNNDTGNTNTRPLDTPSVAETHLAAHGMPPHVDNRDVPGATSAPLEGEAAIEAEKKRPWGPNSFFRSGIVVMGILIAGLLFIQLFSGGPAPN
jgi:hypothetical protein